jgi:hypothetical protein
LWGAQRRAVICWLRSLRRLASTKAESSWVRADRLEYPHGEAVPDVPLASGTVRKKALAQRAHPCGCGFAATREAAALAMLAAGLRLTGREPTWARASEAESAHQSREAA